MSVIHASQFKIELIVSRKDFCCYTTC